jgi:transposase
MWELRFATLSRSRRPGPDRGSARFRDVQARVPPRAAVASLACDGHPPPRALGRDGLCQRPRERQRRLCGAGEGLIVKRTIGIDLGVTSASRLAVAEGSTILSNRRVSSSPTALTRALRDASAGESVDVVLESTAMAWFVAAVAAERAGIEHTLYRVSGRKAAALRAFYRAHTKTDRIDAPVLARMPLVDDALRAFTLPTASELALKRLVTYRSRLVREATRAKGRIRSMLHWAAPGFMRGHGISDGFVRLLQRWPDLRQLARAQVRSLAAEAGIELDRAREVRQSARDAIAFYRDRVDYDALALEIEINTDHLNALARHIQRLDERITLEHRRAYPDDVLLSIPGIGPVVASVLRATIGDARDFKNASTFRAYTGLTPREDSSGDAQRRGRISKAGPTLLRWALYLAADVARKHDPQLADLYRRLMVERGRHHNQALCAVATHLTDRIYALLREHRTYQPRDLEGRTITTADATRLAASLAVDSTTRERLRNRKRPRGPREPQPGQPTAPQGTTRPSRASLADQALEHAQRS